MWLLRKARGVQGRKRAQGQKEEGARGRGRKMDGLEWRLEIAMVGGVFWPWWWERRKKKTITVIIVGAQSGLAFGHVHVQVMCHVLSSSTSTGYLMYSDSGHEYSSMQ